jgi:hypothetical protein
MSQAGKLRILGFVEGLLAFQWPPPVLLE